MTASRDKLAATTFDIAIIGGGINGAAAAREAAQAGYAVALFEKGDYGSGATSRSSRLMHCGLRYLAPGGPMSAFLRQPRQLLQAIRTVKRSMTARNTFVRMFPNRVRPIRMQFPIYADGPYRPWQVDAAFALLNAVSDRTVPLDYRRVDLRQALSTLPFIGIVRNRDAIRSVATYTEYQFDWPERIAVDLVLEAERYGAVAMNHTPVTSFKRDGDLWRLRITRNGEADADVSARLLLNFAGPWIDDVNKAGGGEYRRTVSATKGAHIVIALPEEFRGHGLMTISGGDHPFYCFPWRDSHFLGPTETAYADSPDVVRTDADDVDHLLHEASEQLPGLPITREHVRYTWAGLRPLTHDPVTMMGARNRVIHDLAFEAGPRMFALTNGSLGAHRITAQDTLATVRRVLQPSGAPQALPTMPGAPPLGGTDPAFSDDELRRLARDEHVASLTDVMWGRTGLVWNGDHGAQAADRVARTIAPELAWDDARVARELAAYQDVIHRLL